MSTRSRSSEDRTISEFDRGPIPILNHFPTLNRTEVISIQILFFALLEVLSLKVTDNDRYKSNHLFQLIIHFLQISKMLPASMGLSAKSIRHSPTFEKYVQNFQSSIQTAMNALQRPSLETGQSTITSVLEKEYAKLLLTTPISSRINIDIPQPDLQLKVPISLTMNGTIARNDFDNIVIFRYVHEFYELDKLGKGAFGSVFRAKNRLDDRCYAIKKIVFNENTDRTQRQAKRALREVRILATLSHPNIVQYHCAWVELVPIETPQRSPPQPKPLIPLMNEQDSLDKLIQFEGQSLSKSQANTTEKSLSSQADESEPFIFESNNHQQILHQSHSADDHLSTASLPRFVSQRSEIINRELIPLRNNSHLNHRLHLINSKIVLFIQMQLCDTTLHDWLRHRDRIIIEEGIAKKNKDFFILNELGQSQCWSIFQQLLTAVEYLHSRSFVHRDIKPRNIFLSYNSKDRSSVHVKLGDFGLTTLFDSQSTTELSERFKIDDSTGVGTALYAPPEQLNSRHCATTDKSDSYSLGIVLYELFYIFPTEMERCLRLSDLRIQMKVNEQFTECYPFESKIIERLISIERENRPSVEELITSFNAELQQRIRKKSNTKRQIMIEQLQEELRDKNRRIQQLELELERKKI